MTILFFGLLFFIINLNPAAALWQGPKGDPGVYDAPKPLNVHGGTVLEGHSIEVKGSGAGNEDTIIGSTGIIFGTDLDSAFKTQEVISVVEFDDSCNPSLSWGSDNCWIDVEYGPSDNFEVSFFKKKIFAKEGLAFPAGVNLTMPGPNAIEVRDTLNDWYGYGIHARSYAPNTDVDGDGVHWEYSGDQNQPEFKNLNPAIWGQAYSTKIDANTDNPDYPYSTGIISTLVGSDYNWNPGQTAFSDMDMNFGVMGQAHGDRSIAFYGKAHDGALTGFFAGTVLNYASIDRTIKVFANPDTDERDWGIHTVIMGYESDIQYHPIEVSTLEPDAVYFGGTLPNGDDTPDVKLCLNDTGNGQQCIDSWNDVASTLSTGNKVFKTINVPSGSDAVASNAADVLNLLNGNNISITGTNDDNVTISMDTSPDGISQINGVASDYLYLDGDNSYGIKIYDKLTVDGDIVLSSGDRVQFVNDQWAIGKDIKTNDSGSWYTSSEALQITGYEASGKGLQVLSRLGGQVRFEVAFGSGKTGIHGTLRVSGDVDFDSDANVDGTITAGELCIGSTCLSEKQLIQLLDLLQQQQ